MPINNSEQSICYICKKKLEHGNFKAKLVAEKDGVVFFADVDFLNNLKKNGENSDDYQFGRPLICNTCLLSGTSH